MISNRCLVVTRPRPQARIRLVCFPYAGGAAHIYTGWAEQLPDWVELCAVDLPGRGTRWNEPACSSMSELLEPLRSVLCSLHDKPYAFFGHSMGAAIAFELALTGVRAPEILFVSARPAPHRYDKPKPIHTLPDDEFAQTLAQSFYSRFEQPLPAELLELFLPMLRADYTISETHRHSGEAALQCPIHAYYGTEDQSAGVDEIAAWRELTSGDFLLSEIPGNHFFIHSSTALVVQKIVSALTSWRNAQ